MPLTSRACSFLASLDRKEHASGERLADALRQKELPDCDAWIEFQERYAGYVEPLGHDWAVWGIVHQAAYWIDPWEVAVLRKAEILEISCADAHPSYDYWLRSDGEFRGMTAGAGPCKSFDVKIEQTALVWAAKKEDCWTRLFDFTQWPLVSKSRLLEEVRHSPVPGASDKYTSTYSSADIILFDQVTRPIVWVRCSAQTRVLAMK